MHTGSGDRNRCVRKRKEKQLISAEKKRRGGVGEGGCRPRKRMRDVVGNRGDLSAQNLEVDHMRHRAAAGRDGDGGGERGEEEGSRWVSHLVDGRRVGEMKRREGGCAGGMRGRGRGGLYGKDPCVCVCVCVCKWSGSVCTCVSVQQGRSAETQVPADGAAELL